jgi:hypothetical protein
MSERRTIERLIFVFDADSGALSAFFDSAKKALRLGGCALCTITHGLAGERSEWRECKEELGVPVAYVHRDEVGPKLTEVLGGKLPAVVAEAGGELVQLMDRDALERCRGSVADLRGRMVYFASTHHLALPTAVRAGAAG